MVTAQLRGAGGGGPRRCARGWRGVLPGWGPPGPPPGCGRPARGRRSTPARGARMRDHERCRLIRI